MLPKIIVTGEEGFHNGLFHFVISRDAGDRIAEDLIATAISPDGVIEATEHKTYPMYSFQWHPEKMRGDFPYPPEGPCTQGLFEDFLRICKENKR